MNGAASIISLRTWLSFLIGDRDAILAIARSRRVLGVGLLFILAATLAREYDRHDLIAEPLWLVLPLGASLVVSFLLYCLSRVVARGSVGFWDGYISFLGLFWMTGPLALFYAVPYERFLSPQGAVWANLATVALLSVWRVGLMVRVMVVIANRSGMRAFFTVMLVAGPVAAAAVAIIPTPVWDIMGGIELSERDLAVLNAVTLASLVTYITLPVWVIGGLASLTRRSVAEYIVARPSHVSFGLVAFAAAIAFVWMVILPVTQREQRLRTHAEMLLASAPVDEAIAFIAAHPQRDFPPQWDPPPNRLDWGDSSHPSLLEIMENLETTPAAPWVREIYVAKFERHFIHSRWAIDEIAEGRLRPRIDEILNRLPEGAELQRRNQERLEIQRQVFQAATQPTTQGAP